MVAVTTKAKVYGDDGALLLEQGSRGEVLSAGSLSDPLALHCSFATDVGVVEKWLSSQDVLIDPIDLLNLFFTDQYLVSASYGEEAETFEPNVMAEPFRRTGMIALRFGNGREARLRLDRPSGGFKLEIASS